MLGDPVWRSMNALSAAEDMKPLLTLLENAPEGWMRETLWRHAATPDVLHRQLERLDVDFDTVERMIRRMGLAALPALLDALEVSGDRESAALVEMIVGIGPDAGPIVANRMDGARPAQQRLLLSIITKLGVLPEGFDLGAYARHSEPAVRREAFRAIIRDPAQRDEAIAGALADPDERIVRLAIGAAMSSCPPKAAAILISRADDPTLSADLRALGIRAAASSKSPATLEFLMGLTAGKRRFLRRRALATATPEVLAALAGLATHWSNDPAALETLEAATKSSDKDIRDAVARRASAT